LRPAQYPWKEAYAQDGLFTFGGGSPLKNGYNLLGVLAILFWSSTIGFSRQLAEQLGPLTAGYIIHTGAGLLGLLVLTSRGYKTHLMPMLRLSPRYLLGCGGLMITYIILLYLSIGLAQNHSQVIVVGLINYLWPTLTLLFSLPILGHRANAWLPVGSLLALAGIGIAVFSGQEVAWVDLRGAWLPYLLILAAAVCWSLYTNLAKRWLGDSQANGVTLFLLGGGVALGLMRLFSNETSTWSPSTFAILAYMILCPAFLAYTFWDLGTRKGKMIFLAALSYFTPLLSTILSVVVLQEPANPGLWLATGMIIAGAALSQASMQSA
jgi:drug/metabolite transporter (DMT)-like permease